jgi:hypothetical protein
MEIEIGRSKPINYLASLTCSNNRFVYVGRIGIIMLKRLGVFNRQNRHSFPGSQDRRKVCSTRNTKRSEKTDHFHVTSEVRVSCELAS